MGRYQHSPSRTWEATDAFSTTSQPWSPMFATNGTSTFHIWLTKRHSFPCSKTPSTDKEMRFLQLALGGGTSPSIRTEAIYLLGMPIMRSPSALLMARPSLPQSPVWRSDHMKLTGFCDQCNPRTHPPCLSNLQRISFNQREVALPPHDGAFWATSLTRSDIGRAYTA